MQASEEEIAEVAAIAMAVNAQKIRRLFKEKNRPDHQKNSGESSPEPSSAPLPGRT